MNSHFDLERPIRAATEVAASHGVHVDRCEILQKGHTLVLRLAETLVARVVIGKDGPRQGSEWFLRESAVACHLAQQGAPVIPMHPGIPPGPHEHLGFTMNFWQFVTRIDDEPRPEEVGRTLFDCHQKLRGFDMPLPILGILRETMDWLKEARPCEMLSHEELNLLRERLGHSIEMLQHFPMQALHGDAHGGNLMNTTQGLLWTDWEDTFTGPVEWDLASIIWNARCMENDHDYANSIIEAYQHAGGPLNHEALQQSLIARAAVMSAWYPILYPDAKAERMQKLRFRLAWLGGQES